MIKLIDCNQLSIIPSEIASLEGELSTIDIMFGYNTEQLSKLDYSELPSNGTCSFFIQDSKHPEGYLAGLINELYFITPSGTVIYKTATELSMLYLNLHSDFHLALLQPSLSQWLIDNIGPNASYAIVEEENGDITISFFGLPIGTIFNGVNLFGFTFPNYESFSYSGAILCSGSDLNFVPSTFGFETETFPHGIYHFEVKYTSDLGEVIISKRCIFIDCGELICQVADLMEKCPDTTIQCDYFILFNIAECQCACNKMLPLYNKIISQIKLSECKPCNGC